MVIWAAAATMMHPTMASLIALVLIGVLLFLLRWMARTEGQELDKLH